MNRFLVRFNLIGTFGLATLLVIQWRVNSRLNQRAGSLDVICRQQEARLEENEGTIRGYIADMDEFRQRLSLTESQLKVLDSRLDQLTDERDQLAADRDHLKAALSKWMIAVAERDSAIKQAGGEIQKLASERNELAGKYNKLVNDWNVQQGK